MKCRLDQRAIRIYEHIVQTPGIRADNGDGEVAFASLLQPRFEFVPKPPNIPVQAAGRFQWNIRKPVQLLQLQPPSFQRAEHQTPALRAKVACQVMRFHLDRKRPFWFTPQTCLIGRWIAIPPDRFLAPISYGMATKSRLTRSKLPSLFEL